MSTSSDDEAWFGPVGIPVKQTIEFKNKKYQVWLPPSLTIYDEKTALVSILLQMRIAKDCEEAMQLVYNPESE